MAWLFDAPVQLLGSPLTWAEILAFTLALWMVLCNMRQQLLGWPLAIISSALYGALFWQGQLYGEASLQLMFIVLAFWGWWQWLRGDRQSPSTTQAETLRPRDLSRNGRHAAALSILLLWPLLGLGLARFTDSPTPYWDALPTVGSVVGQILLARKYRENWLVWIAVNLVSVTLFAYKGFWLTVVLYAAFVPLSVAGWRAWAPRPQPHRA